jgi:two-component system chemotaxis response regulator CheY
MSEPSSSPRGRATRTILLVEDSQTTRLLVKAFLVGRDFAFVEAVDGAEALQVFDQAKPDLVICDVNMPRMDGVEFVRRLRQKPGAGRLVPVIVASSQKASDLSKKCLAAGASAFLSKPIAGAELLQLLDRLLGDAPGSARKP